jgi:transcriptional regulator with XRE-family HTH domain
MDISKKVKDICKEKNINLGVLAERLGIARTTLYFNLRNNPTVKTLENIANALGISITQLLGDEGNVFYCPHCGTRLVLKEETDKNKKHGRKS